MRRFAPLIMLAHLACATGCSAFIRKTPTEAEWQTRDPVVAANACQATGALPWVEAGAAGGLALVGLFAQRESYDCRGLGCAGLQRTGVLILSAGLLTSAIAGFDANSTCARYEAEVTQRITPRVDG